MQNNNTYIGITIGPILKTIENAKATRELWLSSYMFSHLMKKLIDQIGEAHIVLPYTNDEVLKESAGGLVPDRIILKGLTLEEVHKKMDSVLDDFSARVLSVLKDTSEKDRFLKNELAGMSLAQNDIHEFFKDYFQWYACEAEVENIKDVIFTINSYLDTAEQMTQYQIEIKPKKDYIKWLFLATKSKRKRAERLKKLFDKSTMPNIPSIIEISAKGLKEMDSLKYKAAVNIMDEAEEDDDGNFVTSLKQQFPKDFKTFHKYIAIVQADGDNVGSLIEQLATEGDMKRFSKALFDFSAEAVKRIEGFGALPIYAGGDDLLFFAPVMNEGKTVFELVKSLDDLFQEKMKGLNLQLDKAPSLSFGVSISYYKFPMNEALTTAQKLLFGVAKNYEYGALKKNALALRVLKHSGQYFSHTFKLGSDMYAIFEEMMKRTISEDEKLIKSITYKISSQPVLMNLIADDFHKIQQYIANSFDEDIHRTGEIARFLGRKAAAQVETAEKGVAHLIYAAYKEVGEAQALDTVYSILRTVNFLKQKDNDQDDK